MSSSARHLWWRSPAYRARPTSPNAGAGLNAILLLTVLAVIVAVAFTIAGNGIPFAGELLSEKR